MFGYEGMFALRSYCVDQFYLLLLPSFEGVYLVLIFDMSS